jgi:hypothetical protein
LASANVRLLGSFLYFCAIEEAVFASAIVTEAVAGGLWVWAEAEDGLKRELRRLLTVEESTAVPNDFRNCP